MKLRITIAGNIYEADVEVLEEDESDSSEAPYASVTPIVPNATSYAAASSNGGAHADADPKACTSPVTGLVIKVNVEAGQAVEAGEQLMVLESMKMETRIMAPYAGRVKHVHVVPGNSVKAGQMLAELE